jgi:oxygen-independent coproporphyrinogen-3 oxidase
VKEPRDRAALDVPLSRYDRPGPRYTSYPTAVEFHAGVDAEAYVDRLSRANAREHQPLSIYLHLPFCEERCAFCGCNVVITRHREVADRYLNALQAELDLVASHLPRRRSVSQLHWGGGTPTYHTADQLTRLYARFARHFSLTADAEVGIEIDPRVTSDRQLATLRSLGFNRLSMGVQDFTPEVQQAVNRCQSYELTRRLMNEARALGFKSINVDLIYGLPYQTAETFSRTLEQVLTLAPERVAVYSFAYVPWIKAHMTHIPASALPMADTKLSLIGLAREAFGDAGYRAIGIDHFARPEDELARAAEAGTLHRNFMGYTVQSARDLVGIGLSAIGEVHDTFVQHTKKLPEYYRAIDEHRFPIERGYALDSDDRVRGHVITELMCNGRVAFDAVGRRFNLDFPSYFAAELAELTSGLRADGLVEIDDSVLAVTPLGRLFVRNVCMVFDRYLRARTASPKPVFSRTV